MKIQELIEILERLDVTPRKSRGQNFLLNDNRAESIVNFAAIAPNETVLEIGPGLGSLTQFILKHSHHALLVEKEPRFAEYLREKFVLDSDLRKIIAMDIRDLELNSIASGEIVVVSNVPYSISSEVILWTVRERAKILRASYLFQREFSERIAANPGTKAYGSLSVLCDVFFHRALGAVISGNEFFPVAEVESRLVKLTRREQPLVEVDDWGFFEKVVRSCFHMRRKTISNNLLQAGYCQDRVQLDALLQSIEIDPRIRGETLNVQRFAALTNALAKLPNAKV